MWRSLDGAVDALRQPAYTGENRCLPCTGVNAVIAVMLAAAVWAVVPLGSAGSVAAAGAVLVVAAAAIALRGYLVPGTPWLTKTYLPDWFLRYFDHQAPTRTEPVDVEPAEVLAAADAVEECDDVDDLCLTDDFRQAWRAAMDRLAEADPAPGDLAAVIDLPERALAFEDHGDAFVALANVAALEGSGREGQLRVGQWESRGAYVADMAAADALGARYPGWGQLAPAERGRVLNGLRIFLDQCPTCDGAVAFGEETVESCCRSMEVVAVTCEDCGARLFEAEAPAA